MSYRFKPVDDDQPMLMPPSVRDWLPKDHLANFLLDVVEEIDLDEIYASYSDSVKGQPPYDPRMLVRILFYGYCTGVFSSRQLERATYEDVPFRVLAGNNHPDHSRICTFRKDNLKALQGIFVQIAQLCKRMGLVQLKEVVLDGTKVKASASKHKAMSYERMKKREKELQEEIARLLKKAEQVDAEEDARFGKDNNPGDVPEELADRKKRLQKIRQAKKALEEEARQAAREKQARRQELERKAKEEGRRVGGHPPKIDPNPNPKAQKNFTDPESCIMKGADGFIQGYNCQAMVDGKTQVIVACDVSESPEDSDQVEPMFEATEENLRALPKRTSMDSNYFSQDNVKFLTEKGVDPYIATGREKDTLKMEAAPRGRIPANATPKERMRRKLQTRRGQAVYRRRKTIAEPAFGQIKNRGFRQFRLRGKEKARGEWALACISHNLLKLHKALGGMWPN